MCFVHIETALIVSQISLSLGFGRHTVTLLDRPFISSNLTPPFIPIDVMVFMFVIVQTIIIKSESRGTNFPSILDAVSRDALIYFVVISSSHLLVVIMYAAARVGSSSPVLDLNMS